jgi:hypothetical protein
MLAPDEKQAGKLPQGVDELLKTMSKSTASLVTATNLLVRQQKRVC